MNQKEQQPWYQSNPPSISHRQPPHLLRRPKPPHILRPQLMHLRVQMLPKHFPKSIHHLPQLRKPQLPLTQPTLRNIRLELLQPVVNLLVLREELEFLAESGHFLRQHGENVPLFDRVVDGEVVREVVAGLQEGAQRHARGLFVARAGLVEEVPGLAEVVVLGEGGWLVSVCVKKHFDRRGRGIENVQTYPYAPPCDYTL